MNQTVHTLAVAGNPVMNASHTVISTLVFQKGELDAVDALSLN